VLALQKARSATGLPRTVIHQKIAETIEILFMMSHLVLNSIRVTFDSMFKLHKILEYAWLAIGQ